MTRIILIAMCLVSVPLLAEARDPLTQPRQPITVTELKDQRGVTLRDQQNRPLYSQSTGATRQAITTPRTPRQ